MHGRALQDISQSRLPLYLDRGWKRNAFLRQVEGNDAPALPTNITEARFTEDVANERINFRGVKADFASMFLFRRKMLLALQGPDHKRFSLLPVLDCTTSRWT